MDSAGTERGKEVRKGPAEDAKRLENAKKILNRGNKLKDLLKTKRLSGFSSEKQTQNKLDFECKNVQIKAKKQPASASFQVTVPAGWGLGTGCWSRGAGPDFSPRSAVLSWANSGAAI
jgi:hypothetical protein